MQQNQATELASLEEHEQQQEPVYQNIDQFLQSIERKAYRMAMFSIQRHSEALDIVQDSMIKLVVNYEQKPSNEWKPLFYRILQNRIRDWQRQQKTKNLLFFWRSDESDEDPIDNYAGGDESLPDWQIAKSEQQSDVLQVLQTLPDKQRQCILLRCWEGLSVADTAVAMDCSQGSVKTHYHRAVTKLKAMLGEQHDLQL